MTNVIIAYQNGGEDDEFIIEKNSPNETAKLFFSEEYIEYILNLDIDKFIITKRGSREDNLDDME